MNKIATSIEQGEELLNMGLEPGTADMAWCHMGYCNRLLPVNDMDIDGWEKTPAWSLTALMNLLPTGTLFLSNYTTVRSEFHGCRTIHDYSREGVATNIFDSVFDLVRQLLSEGYIQKKGKE